MTFNDFYKSMSPEELSDYADRCGTTVLYLKHQLRRANKVPRNILLNNLWQESGGKLSRQDVLDHFFPKTEKVA
jgi:hypothetical protein